MLGLLLAVSTGLASLCDPGVPTSYSLSSSYSPYAVSGVLVGIERTRLYQPPRG